MESKEYWDSVAEKKEFSTPFQQEEFCKYVDKKSIVLDVGCGYGRTLNELHNLGYEKLIGIDFSKAMIDRGIEKYPFLDLRLKKSSKIDFEDSSVDAVILFAVLTCIYNSEEQKELISEIRRVLKPNGVIYINDFLLNNDERNLKRYREFENEYGFYGTFRLPDGGVCRHHSEEWIKELLKEFNELEYQKLIFTTMNGNKSNGFFYIGKKNNG